MTMVQLENAQQILRSCTVFIHETEMVSLQKAIGRVLAEDVKAATDQPPFPR